VINAHGSAGFPPLWQGQPAATGKPCRRPRGVATRATSEPGRSAGPPKLGRRGERRKRRPRRRLDACGRRSAYVPETAIPSRIRRHLAAYLPEGRFGAWPAQWLCRLVVISARPVSQQDSNLRTRLRRRLEVGLMSWSNEHPATRVDHVWTTKSRSGASGYHQICRGSTPTSARWQTSRSIHGTARVKPNLGYPRCPVILDLGWSLRAVRHPITGIPDHHAWRVQCVPGTLLVHDPNGAVFYQHDDGPGGTESFDPPFTVGPRAATAVSVESQHALHRRMGCCRVLTSSSRSCWPLERPRHLSGSVVTHRLGDVGPVSITCEVAGQRVLRLHVSRRERTSLLSRVFDDPLLEAQRDRLHYQLGNERSGSL